MKYLSTVLLLSIFAYSHGITFYVNLDTCPNTTINCIVANATDTFNDLQYALTFVNSKAGGEVVLQNGTYIVGKNLEMFNSTTLLGQGIDNTYIKLKDFAPPFKRGNSPKAGLIRATVQNKRGCDNIAIMNLTLAGNKANQYTDHDHQYGRFGIFTEVCHNASFDRVKIVDMQGYGFDPHGIKPTNFAYNLTITNSIANDNDWDGFTLDQSINIQVENCSASNNGRHGFNIVTASRHTVLSNITTNRNGYYYYKGDPGCGIAMQINKGFNTQILSAYNAYVFDDKKGGFCTTGNVSHISLSNMTIFNADRCIHLTPNVTNVTIFNVNCWNAKRFMIRKNVINLVAFNNTLNGTAIKPVPSSSPSPKCGC
jgi:parallel beta-helix repeat protein